MEHTQIEEVAQLLKSIAHPIRLKILCLLRDKELSVGEIHREIKTTHANITQHLKILRNQGIISYHKDANFIFNRIADKRINVLIHSIQNLYCTDEVRQTALHEERGED